MDNIRDKNCPDHVLNGIILRPKARPVKTKQKRTEEYERALYSAHSVGHIKARQIMRRY